MGTTGTEPIVCMTGVQTIRNLVSLGPLVFTVMLFSMINSTHNFVSKYSGEKCDLSAGMCTV